MDAYKDWSKALYQLDDQTFLAVMRNYLGPIKTPFNKPDLIRRLTRFVTQERIKRRLISLITDHDKKILNAIYMLKKPTIDDIYHFFAKEIQYYIIQQTIINLEERLLILQQSDRSLQINPLFISDLYPSIINIHHIIAINHSESAQIQEHTQYLFEQPFFLAVFSIISTETIRINSDGTLRKSSQQLLLDTFSFLTEETITPFFDLLFSGLFGLNMIAETSGIITLNNSCISSFLERDWKEFFFLFLSYCFSEVYPDTALQDIAGFLYELFAFLGHQASLTSHDLIRLWNAICSHYSIPIGDTDKPFHILKVLGILYDENGTLSLNPLVGGIIHQDSFSKCQKNQFIIDSDFTIICDASLQLKDAQFLYLLARIKTIDTHYVFEITKKTCIHAFDASYSLDEIFTLLSQLSQNEIPHNLTQTIIHWKQEYDSLQIYSGIIVSASEQRSRIIEKHPGLKEHIIKRFGPGLYLFDPDTEDRWRAILSTSGFDALPQTKSAVSSLTDLPVESSTAPDISSYTLLSFSHQTKTCFFSSVTDDHQDPEQLDFIHSLKNKLTSMQLTHTELEEMEARIDKRLILSETQLVTTYLHPTVFEAKGFDYQGKLNLCKQAIASKTDLLELHIRSLPDREDVLLIRPKHISKEGNNHILTGFTIPEHQEFSKSLRKIFLLRKMKNSLYSPV